MASMSEPVPPTPVLPYDAQVEYLSAAGTQWIETSYCPNSATVIHARYYCPHKEDTPFAVRWTGANTYDTFGVYVSTSSKTIVYYGRFSSSKYTNVSISYSQVIDLTIGLSQITANSATYNITRSEFTSSYPLFIFCMNNMGTASMGAAMQLYSLTITEGEVTVMDLIPVRNDGVGYMYDRISGQLLGNSGNGAFTYGDDV